MLEQRTSGVVCEQHIEFYTKMKTNKLGLMMAAMVIAGWMQVGLGQNLELNESFEISVGDTLEFEFQDQGCGAGYQGVWLDDGQLNYMVYMQDCGWGPWAPGKKGNDIYYAMGQARDHSEYKDPVYRSIGWHEAKYRVTESEIIQEVDGEIVERYERGSKDYWALTERTKTAKVSNDHPNSLIRPSSVRNIKLVKGDDQPEPTGTTTNFTFETPKINSKGNLIIKAKGPDNSSVTYQFTYDLINWQDQFTLPMTNGESTITLPVPKTSQDSQFFYRLKLVE